MAIVRTGETEYEKELAKWDKPYVFKPFPTMVYQATKVQGAITVLSDEGKHDQKTTRVVNSERELAEALASGWHPTPQAAYEALQRRDEQHADDAAVVNYEVSKMSKKAQAEFKAKAAASDKHIVE